MVSRLKLQCGWRDVVVFVLICVSIVEDEGEWIDILRGITIDICTFCNGIQLKICKKKQQQKTQHTTPHSLFNTNYFLAQAAIKLYSFIYTLLALLMMLSRMSSYRGIYCLKLHLIADLL